MTEATAHFTALRSRLVGRIHTEDVRRMVACVATADGDGVLTGLFGLLSDADRRVADNAAWVLSRSGSRAIRFLQPCQNRLIDLLMETTDDTLRRLLLSILRRQTFDKRRFRTDFLDFCLRVCVSTAQPVGIRAQAMYVAYHLCKVYPELLDELAMTLHTLDGEVLQPGLRHARNSIISAIE